MRCFRWKGVQCYYSLAILIFISSIFISVSIFLTINLKYSKIHLVLISIISVGLFLIDHNDGIERHGFFNFILFTLIILLIYCFLSFLKFLYYLYKKNIILLIIIIILIIFFFLSFKIYKSNNFVCDNWSKGLNNSFIDNKLKDYPCFIKIPKNHSCYLYKIGPFFDFTSKYRISCLDNNILKKEKKHFLNNFKNLKFSKLSKKNHFGFPLTNNIDPYDYGTILYKGKKDFQTFIYDNTILMDLYNKNKKKYYPNVPKPEIEVKFENGKGNLFINVHKNRTLIKEREKLILNNKKNIIYKNILVFFFDTVSRAHFFFFFPKTIKFLNKFSKYEMNPLKKKINIFQFFKYHSLNTYTDPNLKAAYYGATLHGNGTHFANFFQKNGFIIGRVNNYCEKETCINLENPKALIHTRWDHEGLSIGCIKEFYDEKFTHKLFSLVKKCLFEKDINDYTLEYLESFWKIYLKQNKLFLFQSMDGHEITGEVIGHFDNIFYNFLNRFYSYGWLKDTVVIIFSDHGMHLNGPLYLIDSQDFYFERSLPSLFMAIPNDEELYINNLYEIIKSNQQTFITPFDIYNTLLYLANKENYINIRAPFGDSLFNEINYKIRYCESSLYKLKNKSQINLYSCSCKIK